MLVTIADIGFVGKVKSAHMGWENKDVSPTYFEWIQSSYQDARFVADSDIRLAPGEGQIAWIHEPYFLHPETYHTAMEKPFDYVLTHNRYFADNNKNWLWVPHGGSWIPLDQWGMREKTKNISILLSDKKSMPGHKLRHEVVGLLGDKIDVFGLERRVKPFEAYAPYRYSIIVENERCPGYFTEKLIDCISVGTIPIYWGCQDVDKYFDYLGIHIIENIVDIIRILKLPLTEMYQYAVPYVKKKLEIAKKYRIVEDWILEHYPFLFEENKP